MPSESLAAQVGAALARIRNPRLDNDLLSAGMIRDLAVTPEGQVSFTFLLGKEDPATLVREARAAVKQVPGVKPDGVKITVVDPAGPPRPTHGPPSPMGAPQSAGLGIPAPMPAELPRLGRVIAVSSGKGGVGKSTVAVNLAVALARQGHRVGLMDADIYGPNIPRMFGVFERPPVTGGRIQPLEAHGVKLMSIGFLVERDAPAIWRGPIIM
ncbi:MAG: P-loop NTPase, partial [Gemmatimonadales bacterium]